MTGDTYCDVASPLLFDNEKVASDLIQQDRRLLVDILIHNETYSRICKNV